MPWWENKSAVDTHTLYLIDVVTSQKFEGLLHRRATPHHFVYELLSRSLYSAKTINRLNYFGCGPTKEQTLIIHPLLRMPIEVFRLNCGYSVFRNLQVFLSYIVRGIGSLAKSKIDHDMFA